MSEKYNRSLLILDEVWSVEIIRAFKISARVLVTTRDISILNVVSKQDQKIVEINTGFTEMESLEVNLLPFYLFQSLPSITVKIRKLDF
jgi:hypothetical protein